MKITERLIINLTHGKMAFVIKYSNFRAALAWNN